MPAERSEKPWLTKCSPLTCRPPTVTSNVTASTSEVTPPNAPSVGVGGCGRRGGRGNEGEEHGPAETTVRPRARQLPGAPSPAPSRPRDRGRRPRRRARLLDRNVG